MQESDIKADGGPTGGGKGEEGIPATPRWHIPATRTRGIPGQSRRRKKNTWAPAATGKGPPVVMRETPRAKSGEPGQRRPVRPDPLQAPSERDGKSAGVLPPTRRFFLCRWNKSTAPKKHLREGGTIGVPLVSFGVAGGAASAGGSGRRAAADQSIASDDARRGLTPGLRDAATLSRVVASKRRSGGRTPE